MILDLSDHGSKSTPKIPVIDTKKLLSNYNRETKLKIEDNSDKIVKKILKKLNLPNDVEEIFQQHEIDIDAFKLLRKADLLEMGVKNPNFIENILLEVAKNQ